MNPFLCVVDLDGGTIGLDALTAALPAINQSEDRVEVLLSGSWAGAWVPSAGMPRPAIKHRFGIVALGGARITNRRSFPAPLDPLGDDLDLVVDHYLQHGERGFRDLIGDFAVVLWDTRRNRLVAVRDALGVKALFYQRRGNRIAVGSHLDCFEPAGFDRGFIADFLAGLPTGTDRTVFADVRRLPAGGYLVADAGRVEVASHWSAGDFTEEEGQVEERAAIEEFGRLFREAVAAQLEDGEPAWAQLSGGLDSSSIVVTAAALAAEGRVAPLLGTETVVDHLSEGDETRYSDLVVRRTGLVNRQVVDYWAWQPDEIGPPGFAEPRAFLPFHARDRALRDLVRRGGGRVLLSGFGSDNYLAGSFDFIADWLRRGRVGAACRSALDLAVAQRESFWRVLRRHGVSPLAPGWLKRRLGPGDGGAPGWIGPDLVAAGSLGRPTPVEYQARQAAEIASIDLALERGVFDEGMEIRYPFLHRPLVEFSLRLPLHLRFRPNRPKWILREAMGPLLPDPIRERQGKGGIDGRLVWSFERERALLEQLIADSHLADLGYVSRDELARAFASARVGATRVVIPLFLTLSLETWLAVRSGWWKRHAPRALSSYQPVQHQLQEWSHVEASVR